MITRTQIERRENPPDAAGELMRLPVWMQKIRDAVGSAIQGEDLAAILKVQIEKARKGDLAAGRFVMDQARKFSEPKGVSIVQNNYYETSRKEALARGATRPDQPITAAMSAGDRAEIMRRRNESGMPLRRADDYDGKDADLR